MNQRKMQNEIFKFYSRGGDSSTTPSMTRGAFFRKMSKYALPVGGLLSTTDRTILPPSGLPINKQAKTTRKRKRHRKVPDIFDKRRRK